MSFKEWWDKNIVLHSWKTISYKIKFEEAYMEGVKEEREKWLDASKEAPNIDLNCWIDPTSTKMVIKKGVEYVINKVVGKG